MLRSPACDLVSPVTYRRARKSRHALRGLSDGTVRLSGGLRPCDHGHQRGEALHVGDAVDLRVVDPDGPLVGEAAEMLDQYCERDKLVVQLDPPRPADVIELYLCEARRQRVDVALAVDLARLAGVDALDELEILRQRSTGESRDDVPDSGRRTLLQTRLRTRVHPCRATRFRCLDFTRGCAQRCRDRPR